MRVAVIVPPAPIVTWDEADQHLHLDGDLEQKLYVESLIAAATAHIDGPEGWLGRSLGLRVLEARLNAIHGSGHSLRLLYPPVVELVSVKWLSQDGIEHDGTLSDFELFDNNLHPSGSSWPWSGHAVRQGAIRVRYRAGFAAVPAPIKAAVLLMVGDLFNNRELSVAQVSGMADHLLQPYRVYC